MTCPRFHATKWQRGDSNSSTPSSNRGKTAKQEIKMLGLCLHKRAEAIGEKQEIIHIIWNTAIKKGRGVVVWVISVSPLVMGGANS